MKTIRIKTRPKPVSQRNALSSLYDSKVAITYGFVDSNNTDGTCNIELLTGFIVERVRILSSGYPGKDPIVGGISYPPIESQVIILHPVDDINSGFILPAPLDDKDEDVQEELLDQGNKKILPGGWSIAYDPELGKYTVSNGDFFVLDIDPDTEITTLVDFHENKFTLDTDGIVIEDKNSNTISMEFGKVLINGNLEILQ